MKEALLRLIIQEELIKAALIQNNNLVKVGGTALTGRDISPDLQVLTDLVKAGDDADDVSTAASNILKALSRLYAFDGATWDRLRAVATNGAVSNIAQLLVAAQLYAKTSATDAAPIVVETPADAKSPGNYPLSVTNFGHLFNGATWDRIRNNQELTLLASAARSADTNGPDQVNYNHKGVVLFVNCSAIAGDDTFKIKVEGKDPVSGTYYEIYTTAEISATGLTVYEIHPEAAAASGGVTAVAARIIPRTWRVVFDYTQVTGVADTITASVAASYVP